jgi:AcrR family transcriptional regulator
MTQQRSEETRTRLLAVSEELFAQRGYDAASVSDICAAAGLSKGAFYHHFPSKLALFQALLQGWLSQLDLQLKTAASQSPSVPATLLAMAAGTGPVYTGAGTRTRIILEFWMQAARQPDLWQTAIAPYHHYLEQFAGLITRGVEEKSFAPVDADNATRIVLALALGLLLESFFDPKGAPWSEVTSQGMRLLIAGLQKGEL